MQVALFMFTADGQRRRFALQRDVTVIGRREDCDLRIPLTEVSRKHCRLIMTSSGLRLEDLGSSNGTFHNGNRVQETMIEPGDHIQVGPVIFITQIEGDPLEDQIQLPAVKDETGDLPADAANAAESLPQPQRGQTKRPAAPLGEDFAIADDPKSDDD